MIRYVVKNSLKQNSFKEIRLALKPMLVLPFVGGPLHLYGQIINTMLFAAHVRDQCQGFQGLPRPYMHAH